MENLVPLPDSSEQSEFETPLPWPTTHTNPQPLIIPPLGPHTHTIILLHGRGGNGPKFGGEFMSTASSTGKTLAETFPSAKWIFPTAPKRRAVIFKRIALTQWFDLYDINNQSYREHLQVEGLQESTEIVHDMIKQEVVSGIPLERIVIGGLSQGCAASLYAMLCFDGRLGGYFGMSGWLPFVEYVESILGISSNRETGELENVDVFGLPDDEGSIGSGGDSKDVKANKDPVVGAIEFLRENISFPPLDQDYNIAPKLQTPIFLGHGALDDRVKYSFGEQARDVLKGLGFGVIWKGYGDLGHWYKIPDEIDDIANFLSNILIF